MGRLGLPGFLAGFKKKMVMNKLITNFLSLKGPILWVPGLWEVREFLQDD